jgi:predicted MFS family arabinose efflux permease
MAQTALTLEAARVGMPERSSGVLLRSVVICLTAFLTVVDLFATQAILPTLTLAYNVTPAAMGFAVNSSTLGMAVAGLIVSLFSQRIDRLGILVSLAVLSIPTALLAVAPDLTTFTVLSITQGLCMASAFTLTLAYLGEECSAADAGGAFAAYITGNVASNLIGRLISAALADHLGLAWNFYFFAALNLAGAMLVYYTVARTTPMAQMGRAARSPFAAWLEHLRNSRLRAAFGIGFCILFAFIGTFTYVNFVLVRPPLSVGPMQLGFVYFVFLPSVLTTLLAGRAVHRLGTRPTLWGSLAIAVAGLPLLLLHQLAVVLLGRCSSGSGRSSHRHCDDLWNLLPTHRPVNQRYKRDRLGSAARPPCAIRSRAEDCARCSAALGGGDAAGWGERRWRGGWSNSKCAGRPTASITSRAAGQGRLAEIDHFGHFAGLTGILKGVRGPRGGYGLAHEQAARNVSWSWP